MSKHRHALWPVGLAIGIAAELIGRPPLPILDAATGFTLIALGLLAWQAQPRLRGGEIMVATGFAWFLGTVASWAVYLHRAPLAQLTITHPSRRLWPESRLERVGVIAAYAYAVPYPVANSAAATIAFAVVLIVVATIRYVRSVGPWRRAHASALAATCTFTLVLIAGTALRIAGAASTRALLIGYEVAIVLVATGLYADLLWGRWTQASMTALVVDLGEPTAAGTLRDRLARTLGDPTLAIGYWIEERAAYVDETGRPVALPVNDGKRAVRLIEDGGGPLAALIHDPAVLEDPGLIGDIAAATRLAVANARLQAEVRARVEQVMASRRRLVEAADHQRRRLEADLHEGAARRLERVADLLADGGPLLADARASLGDAQAELRELARGLHPVTLTRFGLTAALQELASRSPVPVELTCPPDRWPEPIESAAYFICSEALANVAKYARATSVLVQITTVDGALRIVVTDNGVGGADPEVGSGLRGLADRAEVLGGQLSVTSPPGRGTRISADLPLTQSD